jgi:hypothetical protein
MLGKFFLSVKWIRIAATMVTDTVTVAMIRAAAERSVAFAAVRSLHVGGAVGERPRSLRVWSWS